MIEESIEVDVDESIYTDETYMKYNVGGCVMMFIHVFTNDYMLVDVSQTTKERRLVKKGALELFPSQGRGGAYYNENKTLLNVPRQYPRHFDAWHDPHTNSTCIAYNSISAGKVVYMDVSSYTVLRWLDIPRLPPSPHQYNHTLRHNQRTGTTYIVYTCVGRMYIVYVLGERVEVVYSSECEELDDSSMRVSMHEDVLCIVSDRLYTVYEGRVGVEERVGADVIDLCVVGRGEEKGLVCLYGHYVILYGLLVSDGVLVVEGTWRWDMSTDGWMVSVLGWKEWIVCVGSDGSMQCLGLRMEGSGWKLGDAYRIEGGGGAFFMSACGDSMMYVDDGCVSVFSMIDEECAYFHLLSNYYTGLSYCDVCDVIRMMM